MQGERLTAVLRPLPSTLHYIPYVFSMPYSDFVVLQKILWMTNKDIRNFNYYIMLTSNHFYLWYIMLFTGLSTLGLNHSHTQPARAQIQQAIAQSQPFALFQAAVAPFQRIALYYHLLVPNGASRVIARFRLQQDDEFGVALDAASFSVRLSDTVTGTNW